MNFTQLYEQFSALEDPGFWQSAYMNFYRAWFEGDRWQQYFEGLGVTILVTVIALLIGVVVMICSLWINDVLVGIDICYGYLSGCVFVPLVASFVLKRFSPHAGLYALGASAVVVTACFLVVGTSSSVPIVAGMATGLAVYAAANLFSKQKTPSPFH